jgi:glycosyltransferase involved in cell wall biosynthesis
MDNKIKVLHIARMNYGSGVASFLMNYYRYLDKSKITFDFLSDYCTADTYEEEITKLGGKLLRAPYYKKNLCKYILYLNAVIKPENYDIVHCHEFVLSVLSLIVAKKNGVRIRISHSHSHSPKSQLFSKVKEFIVFLSHSLFKWFGTDFFACSIPAGKFLFGKHRHIEIIHNAIDTDKFLFNQVIRKNLREELGISDALYVLGYVARFDKQKNHEFLIEIFQKLLLKYSDIVLLLVGDGDNQDYIKKLASDTGLSEKIIFYGISNNIYELYSVMDVFVFPSLAEGLGIVGIEAQCSGLPVIASSNIPHEMQITDLVTWLDLDDGANKWADVILEKLLSVSMRVDMSEAVTIAGYNIFVESKRLENKYMQLCNDIYW